jgi:hypothetical protein
MMTFQGFFERKAVAAYAKDPDCFHRESGKGKPRGSGKRITDPFQWPGNERGAHREIPAFRSFPVLKPGKKGDRVIDARPLVKSIRIGSSHHIELVMSHGEGPEVKPADLIKEIFKLNSEEVTLIRILKTKQIIC